MEGKVQGREGNDYQKGRKGPREGRKGPIEGKVQGKKVKIKELKV